MRVLYIATAAAVLLTGIVRAVEIGDPSPPPPQPSNSGNPVLVGGQGGAGVATVLGDGASPAASVSGGNAELLQRVRADSFKNIDQSLGIDSEQLLADRLSKLGGSISVPDSPDDGGTPARNRSGVSGLIKRILNSDQASNILGLVATGGVDRKLLVPVIIGLLRDVAGRESGSIDGSQISEADLKFLENEANHDAVVKALQEVQKKEAEFDRLQLETKKRQDELSTQRDAEVAKLDQKLAQDAETKRKERDAAAKEKEQKLATKLNELNEKLRKNEKEREALMKELGTAKQEP